jgi:hypothetical protein
MRTVLVGDCAVGLSFRADDPDAPNEDEIEYAAVKALSCIYTEYDCVVFTGGFRYDEQVLRPDLALVAKDRSHWFVIEVELVSHSLERHVLPQVRAFRYGEPEPDCITALARELKIDPGAAATLVRYVPRSVAVIANKRIVQWEYSLQALSAQLLTVAKFTTAKGEQAIELAGALEVVSRSRGFGKYSATDRSIQFPRASGLRAGKVQLSDLNGNPALWTAQETTESIWLTKDLGTPDLPDGKFVQLVETVDGRFSLRLPR